MLQARQQTGGDARWYCPERDLVWAFPRLVKGAIAARFEAGKPVGNLSLEQVGQQCQKLAKLLNKCTATAILPDELRKELDAFDPEFLTALSESFFKWCLGEFRMWCADVSPRTPQDAKIDLSALESEVAKIAR